MSSVRSEERKAGPVLGGKEAGLAEPFAPSDECTDSFR